MVADKAVGDQVGPDDLILDSLNIECEEHGSIEPNSMCCPCIEYAVALATKAVVADYKRQYDKALKLYKESEKYFVHVMEYDTELDEIKKLIRDKLKLYQDRAAHLTSFLDERRRLEKLKELAAV